MNEKESLKGFDVHELEEKILEAVSGGSELLPDIDISCKDNGTCPNSGNCVSGCACT